MKLIAKISTVLFAVAVLSSISVSPHSTDQPVRQSALLKIRMLLTVPVCTDGNEQAMLEKTFAALPFHRKLYSLMHLAARDLDIDFKASLIPLDSRQLRQKLDDEIANEKIDAFILISAFRHTLDVIKHLEKRGVPFIILNANSLRNELGTPREKYRFWIGEILPDDEAGGYLLARNLISRHRKKFKSSPANIVAFAGTPTDDASVQRLKGLKRAVQEEKNTKLLQIFSSFYQTNDIKDKFFYIKNSRYPETDIVWCAADSLAIASIDAAEETGFHPGREMLFGGVDWNGSALRLISEKKMEVSMGGHFIDGALSLVLLHDYLKGYDFKSQTTRFRTSLLPADLSNIKAVEELNEFRGWEKADFKKLSKAHNPDIEAYDFSYTAVLERVNPK